MYYRIMYNPRQKNAINNFIKLLYNNFYISHIDINELNTQKFKITYNDKKIYIWIQKLRMYESMVNSNLPYDIENNDYDISNIVNYTIKTNIPEETNPVNIDNVKHPNYIDLMDLKTPEFAYIFISENEEPRFCENQFEGYFILNEKSDQNKKIIEKMFFLD